MGRAAVSRYPLVRKVVNFLKLRDRCEGNFVCKGEYREHVTSVWNKLSSWSKEAVNEARKAAKK